MKATYTSKQQIQNENHIQGRESEYWFFGEDTVVKKKDIFQETLSSNEKHENHGIAFIKATYGFQQANLVLYLSLASLVLFTWFKVRFSKNLDSIFIAAFRRQFVEKLFEEKSYVFQQLSNGIFAISIVNISLLIFLASQYFGFSALLSGKYGLLYSLGILSTWILFRYLMQRLIGYTFNEKVQVSRSIFNQKLYGMVYGIIIFPIILFAPYMPEIFLNYLFFIALLLCALFFVLYFIRGIRLFICNWFSLFDMILYICTLEILPVFAIIKIVSIL